MQQFIARIVCDICGAAIVDGDRTVIRRTGLVDCFFVHHDCYWSEWDIAVAHRRHFGDDESYESDNDEHDSLRVNVTSESDSDGCHISDDSAFDDRHDVVNVGLLSQSISDSMGTHS